MVRDDFDELNYIFIKILVFVLISCCLDWLVFFKDLFVFCGCIIRCCLNIMILFFL